jgi:UDP-3-O-[3-hydroxymyristoyl] glucosamine N-acyltransferase
MVLIIFGEFTAEEVRAAVERDQRRQWSRIEKCHVELEHTQQSVSEIARRFPGASFNVGIADIKHRREVAKAAEAAALKPFTVIDPSASIDPKAKIGEGCFIAANTVISTGAQLQNHVLVHFNSTVGHNATIGSHSVILPGARLSGHCQLGTGVMIGSNAFAFQGIHIGDEVKVDALTYVYENIPARRVVSVRRPGL